MRTPSSRIRRSSGTRFRHSPAARRIVAASCVGAGNRLVAGHRLEIVVAELEADGPPGVAGALQVLRNVHAEIGEDAGQLGAVAPRVEVAVERGLAADGFGLAVSDDRALVAAVRRLVHPRAVVATELLEEPQGIGLRQFADGADAERFELCRGLRADAVDPARRQRPDARRDVGSGNDRDAVRLVEVGGDLREQLVRRDADRRRQPGCGANRILDRSRDRKRAGAVVVRAAFARDIGRRIDVGQVDVDFVDAAVLDLRRDSGDRGLEQPRIPAVRVEIGGQPDRVGREARGLHESHAGMHAERARFVGRGRGDTRARRIRRA